MKAKCHWRMPNNSYTSSFQKASKAWKDLYQPFCDALDCKIIGYDPDIQFGYGSRTFTLPVSLVEKIVSLIPKEK